MSILKEALKTEFVIMDLEVSSKQELLEIMATRFEENGIVKDTYKQAVLDREEVYPTGLLLGDINIAIPHCDNKHANTNAIAIAKLTKPITFKYMADPEIDVPVSFAIMLSISNPKDQVPVLSSMIEVLSKQENMKELILAESAEQIINIIINKEA